MDPLSAYLLSVLKNEKTNNSRRFSEHELALNEMGYYCLIRPAGVSRDAFPPCGISLECKLVGEFPSYCPPILEYDGFDIVVDVYADPNKVPHGTY